MLDLSIIRLDPIGSGDIETVVDENSMLKLFAGLSVLLDTQGLVSGMVSNALPHSGPPTRDQVRTYFLATMVELVELMNELNWKPWKRSEREPDVEKVADEFADILAFLGVILNYLKAYGIDPYTLAGQYARKSKINVDRFNGLVEGY
jgi:hypothetical protein